MYKIGSFEEELYRSMEKTLVKNQVENKYGFDKLAQAADLLNAAASLFEEAGLVEEANEVTQVLQDLANQLKSK
jgi:hypothetical protein